MYVLSLLIIQFFQNFTTVFVLIIQCKYVSTGKSDNTAMRSSVLIKQVSSLFHRCTLHRYVVGTIDSDLIMKSFDSIPVAWKSTLC